MTIKNKKQFLNKLRIRLVKNPDRKSEAVMESATRMVMNDVIQSINNKGKGRIYYRKGIPHQASAPGDPPATDTGELKRNIAMSVTKRGRTLIGKVFSGMEYSVHLEFGTSKMEKRPFMGPALRRNQNKITRKFKNAGMIK